MMGVHIDDDHVVEFAPVSLLAGVGQQPRGVQFVNGDAAAAIGVKFHDVLPNEAAWSNLPAA
jgi:hypothetical protein